MATSQRRPYCAPVNSHSPIGLVSPQWDTVDSLCIVWPSHSQISSLSMAILALGKARLSQRAKSGLQGGWQTWAMWCFAKKAWTRAIEQAGALSWWSWSACSVLVNVMVTQYTSSVNGISLPTDYSHGRVTVHGCRVRSPLTGCQVTSWPCDRFSRHSKWLDIFQTALIHDICHRLQDLPHGIF